MKKESAPDHPKCHAELEETRILTNHEVTERQKLIGMLQWIQSSLRLDICLAVSSLVRCQCGPREGHLAVVAKTFAHLKKHPERGTEQTRMSEMKAVKPDFGNQCCEFNEEMDDEFPEPLMDEIGITIIVDSNHGHGKATGKSTTCLTSLLGSKPVSCCTKWQSSFLTSTFGAEFVSLKNVVEEAVILRCFYRSFGMKVTKPTTTHEENVLVAVNCTNPGSTL